MTTALVLSGGGNLGAVQAGQLQALIRAGIRPDLIVGTSVGAINGGFLAGPATKVAPNWPIPGSPSAASRCSRTTVDRSPRFAWRAQQLRGPDRASPTAACAPLLRKTRGRPHVRLTRGAAKCDGRGSASAVAVGSSASDGRRRPLPPGLRPAGAADTVPAECCPRRFRAISPAPPRVRPSHTSVAGRRHARPDVEVRVPAPALNGYGTSCREDFEVRNGAR